MSLIIDLPADIEAELTAESERRGVPVGEIVADRIRGPVTTDDRAAPKPLVGKALVDYWRKVGIVGSRRDIDDSLTYARELRAAAERRTYNPS